MRPAPRLPLLLTSLCSTLALAAVTLTTPGAAAAPAPAVPATTAPATAEPGQSPRTPPGPAVARGRGGAVSSVDPNASAVGLRVLQQGGNAVDAAVATAAALGVTEPYSAGIGGGGYFVYYDARSRTVRTIDGRETAPRGIRRDAFIDPATGDPYTFTPDLVTSGVAVGVPGTPLTWSTALRRWGSRPLSRLLAPAERLAREGFVVDDTFRQQTLDNEERFAQFTSTRRVYLRGGRAPGWAACTAIPRSRARTSCSPATASARSTAAPSPATSRRRSAAHRRCGAPRCRCPRAA